MTRYSVYAALLFATLSLAACSLFGKEEGNDLGGSSNVDIARPGVAVTAGSVQVGDQYVPIDGSLLVTKNEGGEVTASVQIDLSEFESLPGFQAIYDAIPSRYKDQVGNISTDLRFKVTSEGILDYANVDEEPHVLVRYDDPVGTKYTLSKSNGRTLTREVVGKSTSDDFPYGFMNIKVSTVDMTVNSGGVRKVTYKANHKFGIVFVQATLDDGSIVDSYLYNTAN